MKLWYAVYTHPRNEPMAVDHLVRQGFDVYFPRYMKRHSHAGRVSWGPAPLFPRYIFVAFDALSSAWRAIRSTRGVNDLVRHGLDPAPVPEFIIDEMRVREDENGLIVLGKHLNLRRGEEFRVSGGPFDTQLAIFETRKDESRIIALLSLLGRKVAVELSVTTVAPVA
jgi:transcriptional antiterminator RfaH